MITAFWLLFLHKRRGQMQAQGRDVEDGVDMLTETAAAPISAETFMAV